MTGLELLQPASGGQTGPEALAARAGALVGSGLQMAGGAIHGTGESFSAMLAKVGAGGGAGESGGANPTDAEIARKKKAEDAAAGLVSNALILPVLKQVRRSVWGEKGVFSGGIGEKAFGPEFDMQLADRIAHSPRLGIKNVLAEKMLQRGKPIQRLAQPVKLKDLDLHG